MTWTKQQEEAIYCRGSNLLVAAAAGSGKTAVLVERIVRLVTDAQVDIDRLLVVTFTNAAAGEMRERISSALTRELDRAGEGQERLRRQLALMNRAAISTMHAFCSDVIRNYFHLVDIDPRFRIADSNESELIRQEVLEELLEAEYEKAQPLFLELVERFGGSRGDDGLQELLMQAYDFIQSQPDSLSWLQSRINDFDYDAASWEEGSWAGALRRQIGQNLRLARHRLALAFQLCRLPGGPSAYEETLEHDLRAIDDLLARLDDGADGFYPLLEQAEMPRLKRLERGADPELGRQAREWRDEAKELLKEIKEEFLFKSQERMISDLRKLYPCLQYLSGLLSDYHRIYRDRKLEKGILDFNDLEHYALEILGHEEAGREYRERFQYIFVDEYQDSNLVQESIIKLIKREDNLFLVGDIKQSIYRFRLADPTIFLEKQRCFREEPGERGRCIDLSFNFRSNYRILDGINHIFQRIMSPELGEIDYDDHAFLHAGLEGKDDDEPLLELYLLDRKRQGDIQDEDQGPADHIEAEARFIVQKIKSLQGQFIWDLKQKLYRKIDYRDIVILLRSTRRWAPVLAETLTACGIPVYADTGSGYFSALEISLFINLLKLIDNRRQDLPLLSVMRSPVGGFDLEEMAEVRAGSPAEFYYQALDDYIQAHNNSLAHKLKAFLDGIDVWKEEARWMPVDEFIWKLMVDSAYYYYCGAMPGGEQRQANLRILLERARQFQDSSMRGLFRFIRYVDRLQAGSGDMGEAKILGENDNVVRIMSIHKSKGLEFPVVILAGTGQQFNLSDSNAPILFHRTLGLGPRYVDPDLRVYSDTLPRALIRKKIRLESLSEEMRLLYVAMTRAENRLLLYGSVTNLPKQAAKWCRQFDNYTLAKGRCYLDWLGPVLIRQPGGGSLRQLADSGCESGDGAEAATAWQVEIIDHDSLEQEKRVRRETRHKFEAWLDQEKSHGGSSQEEVIRERLNWVYPFRESSLIPSKLSATRAGQTKRSDLIAMRLNAPVLRRMPAFSGESASLTAAEIGTATHLVMQHLDLTRVADIAAIQPQVEDMVAREILRTEEAAVIDTTKIAAFFSSPLGRRILAAKEIYRERPFNLLMPAAQVVDGMEDCDEELLVQGVIDLYFYEGDALVLVDYKTGYMLDSGDRDSIVERYRGQLEIYRQALETILGQKVKEAYLYLFDRQEALLL